MHFWIRLTASLPIGFGTRIADGSTMFFPWAMNHRVRNRLHDKALVGIGRRTGAARSLNKYENQYCTEQKSINHKRKKSDSFDQPEEPTDTQIGRDR